MDAFEAIFAPAAREEEIMLDLSVRTGGALRRPVPARNDGL